MGAMRIARTVTGRNTIVLFTGSYHGIFDEVDRARDAQAAAHVRPRPASCPSARRTCSCSTTARPSRCEFIRARADELAAVLVEPVQSRRPDFQPREFLQELRQITEKTRHAA